jgi:cobalt-zinc-cadmium efflux system membrane fusion protein
VPSSAVVRHEGKPFVFVEREPGHYANCAVTLGLETSDWTEIREGLEEGQLVVSQGAFKLKSELLLEGD